MEMNKPDSKNLEFRSATVEDADLILSYIIKLAAYEKLENEVVATPDLLREWIFEKKGANVIFPMLDGKEIGFALYFHNFSTFLGRSGIYLEDLYIEPEFRHMGYGKQLFSHLASICENGGCGRLEWWCLDANKPSIGFYQSIGAQPMDEWTVFRLTGKTLSDLAGQA